MILFRRFAFSNFPPVGLCNFLLKLSPLVGGLISFIFFLLSRGNSVFPLCWGLVVLFCRLWLLYSDSLPDSCFSYSCLRESRSLRRRYLTCRSFQLLWQYSQTAVHFGMVWEEFASFPRGWASAFPPFGRPPTAHAERAAGARPSSACVEPCGDLWLLLQSEQTHLPASQSVSTGGFTRRSVPGQLCGLALLTR